MLKKRIVAFAFVLASVGSVTGVSVATAVSSAAPVAAAAGLHANPNHVFDG